MRSGLGTALLALGLSSTLGATACAGRQVRALSAKGAHDEAVARAERARRAVRDEAARALASSLLALGRLEQARATLQADYRHGGHLASLVMLAEAELDAGLVGIATAHYARALALDPAALEGAPRACEAFLGRAGVRQRRGESIAADADLRRAKIVCAPQTGTGVRDERWAALWAEVERDAAAEVTALRRLEACPPGGCDPESAAPWAEQVEARLASARADGPRALHRLALEGVAPGPEDVARLLDAELHGEVTTAVVDDADVRAWVSDLPTDALLAAADAHDARTGAYARLRLARIRSDVVPRADLPAARQSWLLRAGSGPGGWRALLVGGRPDEAELALVQELRAQRVSRPADAEGRETGPGPVDGDSAIRLGEGPHWTSQVPVDEISLPELLVLGRMLELRGRTQLGFEVRRDALRRGVADEVRGARAALSDAMLGELLAGAPWRAWMLAELEAGAEGAAVVAAAAAQLNLRAAVRTAAKAEGPDGGGARSGGSAEAARIMGDAWLTSSSAAAARPEIWLVTAGGDDDEHADCGVRTAMVSDDDPLGALLWEVLARRSDPTGRGERLAAAFEADPGLGCRGRLVGRALGALEHDVAADRMSERYAHVNGVRSTSTLEAFAVIALAAGRSRQASVWIEQAAALSTDPLALWRRAANDGRRLGAREYELHALRQALLLSRGYEGLELRRALLISRLTDYAVPPPADVSQQAPDRASVVSAVDEHFERLAPAMRWAEGERLLAELRVREVGGAGAGLRLTEVLADRVAPEHHFDAWSAILGVATLAPLLEAHDAPPSASAQPDAPIDDAWLDAESAMRRRVRQLRESAASGSEAGDHARTVNALLGALSVAPAQEADDLLIQLSARLGPAGREAVMRRVLQGAASLRAGRVEPMVPGDAATLDVVLAAARRRQTGSKARPDAAAPTVVGTPPLESTD